MVAEARSPTVRQRELGLRLRSWRNERHLTVEEVAEKILCHPTKISRAETGARRPTLRDVRDLCELYGVGPLETAELMQLAREARQPGWWTRYDALQYNSAFLGLEQDATAITCFSMYFVPGLMQTEDYARALIKSILPRIDEEVLKQRVGARLQRQRTVLERPEPPRYRALLDEAVLHRQVGGPEVLKAQLGRILQLIEEEKATVQVIPFEVGSYMAADSNFDYLEFGGASPLPDVVYVEGLTSQGFIESLAELKTYTEAVERLRDIALSPRSSRTKIHEICRG